MTPIILDGKALAEKILITAKQEIIQMTEKPNLTVIQIGDNQASNIYVRNKHRACEKVGIKSQSILLPANITQQEVLEIIIKLNNNPSVTGLIVQLPIPDHLYVPEIIKTIDPKKDVDGFTAYNLGKMFLATEFEHLPPATPGGIIKILEEYKINPQGMNVTVVGHSNIVGKPISTMLLNRNATVTTCHIHTKNLQEHTLKADLLIVAVGKPNLITADMVKQGVIIIDVGINKDPITGKLCGDVDFENVAKKASMITPVPGGVGPMTIASLIINTIAAKIRQSELE